MSTGDILIIGGYATSGKDAYADALVSELGWYKTYMSKPLEQALLTLNPIVRTQTGQWVRYSDLHAHAGYDRSKQNPEVRRLLQKLGTEVGRMMFYEDCWLDIVLKDVIERVNAGQNVVVTGIRYENEIVAFKRLMAQSLWIERPGVTPVNNHSSENTLTQDDFQLYFYNNGTLHDIRKHAIDTFG